jgi:hypothetical protein
MNTILKIRNLWNHETQKLNPGATADHKIEQLRRRERSAAEHPVHPYGLDLGRIA